MSNHGGQPGGLQREGIHAVQRARAVGRGDLARGGIDAKGVASHRPAATDSHQTLSATNLAVRSAATAGGANPAKVTATRRERVVQYGWGSAACRRRCEAAWWVLTLLTCPCSSHSLRW